MNRVHMPNNLARGKLIRSLHHERGTCGTLYTAQFSLATLERPWLNNERNVSCIPIGKYIVRRNRTGRFQFYELLDVPNRTHIEIHPANWPDQLAGCIALGREWMINAEGVPQLTDSRQACNNLLATFGDDDWVLEIENESESTTDFD